MFTATDGGGTAWFIQTDEVEPLAVLRGLPNPGSGYPWSEARNGALIGGSDAEVQQVAQGFDKSTATAFACDREWRTSRLSRSPRRPTRPMPPRTT